MSQITLVNQASGPGAPAAGRVSIFAKLADGHLYIIDENGVQTDLTAGLSDAAVRKASVGTIDVGEAVYLVGWDLAASVLTVERAQANSVSTMPALGVISESATDATNGSVRLNGQIDGIDTSAWAVGSNLYVSTSVAGSFTVLRPTGTSDVVQQLCKVAKSDASTGVLVVQHSGHGNDLPQLSEGMSWIGDSNNQPIQTNPQNDTDARIAIHDADVAAHAALSRVDGTRAFTGEVAGVTPTVAASLTRKDYVDTEAASAAATAVSTHDADITAHTALSRVDGTRAFTGEVAGITPTTGPALATKSYVDSVVQGIEWQDNVLDRDLATPPALPTTGDRYIVASGGTGPWATHDDDITEYNGASWDFTVPTEGMTVGVDDENRNVRWNTVAWVFFGTTIDHGNLAGLGDDDHLQYTPVSGARAFTGEVGGVTPTVAASLTRKDYVDTEAASAAATAVSTHNADASAHAALSKVDGSRPFTGEVGGVTPTLSASLATKAYVDSEIDADVSTHNADASAHAALVRTDGSRSLTGELSGITPTAGGSLATKDYVDSVVQGIEWQDSVLDRDLTAPPGSPVTGDRHIVASPATGTWTGLEDNIVDYNGSTWDATAPTTGMTIAVDDENRNLRYNGSAWVFFGTTIDHGNMIGLGDDDHTQYSRADGSRDFTGEVAGVTPTVSASLATKGYVDTAIDSDVVTHNSSAGAHTALSRVDGSRSFTGEVAGITPTVAASLATKGYVDAEIDGDIATHNSDSSAHTALSRVDGSRPFTGVVAGVTPTLGTHLTTKSYVDAAIDTDVSTHDSDASAHTALSKVDGSRAFTGAVSGISPTLAAHLATKSYVDTEVDTDIGTHNADAGAHTALSRIDGTRAFTGEVAGVTPTVDASLATKGYVDSAVDTDISTHNADASAHTALARVDGSRPFTGDVSISNSGPQFSWLETDQAVNEKGWVSRVVSSQFQFNTGDDSGGSLQFVYTIDRSGGTPTAFTHKTDVFISNAGPSFIWIETDQAVNEKGWLARAVGGQFQFNTGDDSGGMLQHIFTVDRAGSTPTLFNHHSNVRIIGTVPSLQWEETDAAADEGIWFQEVTSGRWRLSTLNDAGSTANDAISITRTGATVDTITLKGDVDLEANDLTTTGDVAANRFAVSGTIADIRLSETGATADEGNWAIRADIDSLYFRTFDDSFSATSIIATVQRTGITPDRWRFSCPMAMNGNNIEFDPTVATNWYIANGTADPEGSVSARTGSLYSRVDSAPYYKSSGSGTTGWKRFWEFRDDQLEIHDNSDATKVAKFEASSITTATTRTMTVPDRDITLGQFHAPIIFSDGDLDTSTTTRYLFPGGQAGTATTSEVVFVAPYAGDIDQLYVNHVAAGTGAANLTYTVRKNASDTSLAVIISNTATSGSDLANSVSVAAGDKISVSVAKSAALSTSPAFASAQVRFRAT